GYSYDNAFIDSVFSSLKYDLVYHLPFATLAQARTAIFDYIETFYNRTRLHSSLDYQTPITFESKLNQNHPYQLSVQSGQFHLKPFPFHSACARAIDAILLGRRHTTSTSFAEMHTPTKGDRGVSSKKYLTRLKRSLT